MKRKSELVNICLSVFHWKPKKCQENELHELKTYDDVGIFDCNNIFNPILKFEILQR
jgi:hypothetical protein